MTQQARAELEKRHSKIPKPTKVYAPRSRKTCPKESEDPPGLTERRFIPPRKWKKYYDWPPEGGLRYLIFHAETNGFKSAFKRVGRNILIIDNYEFWRIVEDQNGGG